MPVTLTDDALNELDKFAPHFYIEGKIIKDHLNANLRTEYDVTENVSRWGQQSNQTTIVDLNWKIPSLTVILNDVNDQEGGVKGGLYNPFNSLSIWNQDNVRHPRLCHLGISVYILIKHQTEKELLYYYMGRIEDAIVKDTPERRVVEIVTTLVQNERLELIMSKEEGQYIQVAYNAY